MTELVDRIKDEARRLGFQVVAITSLEPLVGDLDLFRDWCDSGFAAGMDYMTRRPELHASPNDLAPWAASLITLAINYYSPAIEFQHENRYGRIARYAWGRDYHDVVKLRLAQLAERIEVLAAENAAVSAGEKMRYRCFVDAVPLLERAVAARAGLGFFGKNTNLLQPTGGSWFFLAEILTRLDLPGEGSPPKVSCGTCTRCLDACPTNAFAGPYRLDSGRCISYLTIENKGPIPAEMRAALGEWLFGCDICQDVCPFNRFSTETDWPEFQPDAGVGTRFDLIEALGIADDRRFKSRFQGTALMRPKRRGLLRNAAVVAANVGCTAAVPQLAHLIESDSEPLIRSHALWALSRLDTRLARPILERALLNDPDSSVRQEAAALM